MTHNRVSGVATGLGITCLVQSSSASTVMVVSFVNAGLLTLVEAIGVIMGANLGTTLTAWIIALVGKFSLAEVAIPIIGVGLPLFFIGKDRWKNRGEILIGFGLLFFGLDLLKNTVPDLRGMLAGADLAAQEQARQIQALVGQFSGRGYYSVLVFFVLGILLTLTVQSSSAAMAITVTLAIQGWIGFHESAAIVLGENIGTTVTAWLASIGTSPSAKRAARAHFLFNVLGVVWMLLLFYPFTRMVIWLGDQLPDIFRSEVIDSDIGFKLAIFHSLFNLTNTCLLIGFIAQIERLVTRWVPEPVGEPPGRSRLKFISGGMVEIGELNLPEAEKATRELADLSREMFLGYLRTMRSPDEVSDEDFERYMAMEDEADLFTHDITHYLVRTSAAEISPENARSVSRMLRIVAELEEISDVVYRLLQISRRQRDKKRGLSPEALAGIEQFAIRIVELIDLYIEVLAEGATEASLGRAEAIERATDKLRKQLNKGAVKRMSAADGEVKTEMIAIDMHNQFELIANYGLNVVQSAYYLLKHDEIPEKGE